MPGKSPPPFSDKDRIKMLLWCDRHCCLCGKSCDTNIVIHHIEQEGNNLSDIGNGIPLCFDCHGRIRSYNLEHRVGSSYRIEEVKKRRDQVYEEYTRHLVPLVFFEITQVVRNNSSLPRRKFPNVGFNLRHCGNTFLPVKARVEIRHILDGKDFGVMEQRKGYYSGEREWHLNPSVIVFGNFDVPKECRNENKVIQIEARVTVIDQYEREHKYLQQCWTYVRKNNRWFLEPSSFAEWE